MQVGLLVGVLVGLLIGVLAAVGVYRIVDRRREPPAVPSGRRARPVLWIVWGVVATGCLFLVLDRTRNLVVVVLVLVFLFGLWAFGGTHRVPVLVRWGVGIVTMAGTVLAAFIVLGLVVTLGQGWLGERALEDDDEEERRLSIEVFAVIDGPTNDDFDQRGLPALVLDDLDAAALGVGHRVEGQVNEGLARWILTTDLEDSADVEHCFVADVSFEGHEEVAVQAGTCVSGDANTIHTELPS